MAHGWSRNQPRPQKWCWCGSGKKQKNCHGKSSAPEAQTSTTGPHLREIRPIPQVTMHPWGVPGEEHKIVVAMIRKGDISPPSAEDLRGRRGKYRVQFLLARPGTPIRNEKEHKFIDDVIGSSHLKIVKPEAERRPEDACQIMLQLQGKHYQLIGHPDKDGFLGKLVCELEADNNDAAEAEVYGAIAPFLSAWSMNADIPIHVETIQVTNLTTHTSSLRVVAPHFEMNFGGGVHPFLRDEFCQYASIYREGLNSNSSFYRFLCFYKIIESLIAKRGREGAVKKQAGQDPRRTYEVIPEKPGEALVLLRRLYPWREQWDQMSVEQIFPSEVLGQRVTAIRDKHLRPLRLGIAHALLDQGEITVVLDKMEYIQAINKWLPLCRLCARWMMLGDFPLECSVGMK
jgi:hypothetical protein